MWSRINDLEPVGAVLVKSPAGLAEIAATTWRVVDPARSFTWRAGRKDAPSQQRRSGRFRLGHAGPGHAMSAKVLLWHSTARPLVPDRDWVAPYAQRGNLILTTRVSRLCTCRGRWPWISAPSIRRSIRPVSALASMAVALCPAHSLSRLPILPCHFPLTHLHFRPGESAPSAQGRDADPPFLEPAPSSSIPHCRPRSSEPSPISETGVLDPRLKLHNHVFLLVAVRIARGKMTSICISRSAMDSCLAVSPVPTQSRTRALGQRRTLPW